VTWFQWANDPAVLKAALRREEQLRLCDAQQDLFAQVEHRRDMDWLDLAEALQRDLVREFFGAELQVAFDPAELMRNALGVLRTAPQRYPDDAEFRTISLYTRYNRARPGHLKAGDRVPDLALAPLAEAEAAEAASSLQDFWAATVDAQKRPLLIIASSWT